MILSPWAKCTLCGCLRRVDGMINGCCSDAVWCENALRVRLEVIDEFAEAQRKGRDPGATIVEVIDQRAQIAKHKHRAAAAAHWQANAKRLNAKKRKPKSKRTCLGCPKDISDKRPQSKYCSPRCQKKIAARKSANP